MGTAAVRVAGLHKCYGDVEAVTGITFEIAEGECFALLGPNGAGKTTTVEILEGFRTRATPTRSSTWWVWARSATPASRRSPAASAAAWTWRSASSATPT